MKKYSFLLLIALLGISLLTSCRPPELEGAFVDFKAGRIDNALVLAKEASEKYPENAEAWLLLGRLYGKTDHIAEMVDAFDRALALNKQYENDINNEKTYYFQTSFNKGVTAFNTYTKFEDRTSEKALKAVNQSIMNFKNANLIKSDYKSTSLIATCYNMSSRPDSALLFYEELIKINPDSADGYTSVGNFHFYNKNYEKSIEYLNKALERDPENVEAITLVSQAYDMLEDTDNAIKAYEKAIELNPEEKAFPYNLGLIYNKLVNKDGVDEAVKTQYYNKMIENFAKVIELDSDIKVAFQMKAFAELQLKKYEEAVNTLTEGLDSFPDDGSLWFNLGVAYTHLQNKTDAEDAFKKAEELGYK